MIGFPWNLLLTTPVLIVAGMLLFYEGLPVGPLGEYLPVLQGRVDRERTAARVQCERDFETKQAAEYRRQIEAGRKAAQLYSELLADAQAKQTAQIIESEKEIAAYEDRLRKENRSCVLDQSDIDWLRK